MKAPESMVVAGVGLEIAPGVFVVEGSVQGTTSDPRERREAVIDLCFFVALLACGGMVIGLLLPRDQCDQVR